MNLKECVIHDIVEWLDNYGEIIANERDLQVNLALALREKGSYDKVHLEYRVPVTLLKERLVDDGVIKETADVNNPVFPWFNSSNYFVDIVVEKDGKFFPIELKYATRSIDNAYQVFGEGRSESILSDKAANDIIMYHYWKDVRRLEVQSKLFKNVVGGISVLVANPTAYYKKPHSQSSYRNFSTREGNVLGGLLNWDEKIGEHVRNNHPSFILDGSYVCRWEAMRINASRNGKEEIFKYLLIEI